MSQVHDSNDLIIRDRPIRRMGHEPRGNSLASGCRLKLHEECREVIVWKPKGKRNQGLTGLLEFADQLPVRLLPAEAWDFDSNR